MHQASMNKKRSQWRMTKMLKGLETMPDKELLKDLSCVTQRSLIRRHMISFFENLESCME